MSTRINRTPSINQFLECPPTINPDKHRTPTCRTEYLTVLPSPLNDHRDWIVFDLGESLVEEGPAADVRWEMGATGVAGEVLVHGEEGDEEGEEFCETEVGSHGDGLGKWIEEFCSVEGGI